MKRLLLISCLVFLFASCSKEVDEHQLVIRYGISYEMNSQIPFTGTATSYHENGQLKNQGTYKNGKLEGLFETFYENGQLSFKTTYKNGNLNGVYRDYHKSGQLHYQGIYKNGEKNGSFEYYRENGELLDKTIFLDGAIVD